MWLIKTRIARGLSLNRKYPEYILTNPNSKVTYGPFSSEVKAKEQANKLNHPAPVSKPQKLNSQTVFPKTVLLPISMLV